MSAVWEREAKGKARDRHRHWVPIREGGSRYTSPSRRREGELRGGASAGLQAEREWCQARTHSWMVGEREADGAQDIS